MVLERIGDSFQRVCIWDSIINPLESISNTWETFGIIGWFFMEWYLGSIAFGLEDACVHVHTQLSLPIAFLIHPQYKVVEIVKIQGLNYKIKAK